MAFPPVTTVLIQLTAPISDEYPVGTVLEYHSTSRDDQGNHELIPVDQLGNKVGESIRVKVQTLQFSIVDISWI